MAALHWKEERDARSFVATMDQSDIRGLVTGMISDPSGAATTLRTGIGHLMCRP